MMRYMVFVNSSLFGSTTDGVVRDALMGAASRFGVASMTVVKEEA